MTSINNFELLVEPLDESIALKLAFHSLSRTRRKKETKKGTITE